MPVEGLAAPFKGENADMTGAELILFSTGRTSQRGPTDSIQTGTLTSRPQSQAWTASGKGRSAVTGASAFPFLSTHSPSPTRFPAPFGLQRRKSVSHGGEGSPIPALQTCVLTNYIPGRDNQLRQGLLAKESSQPESNEHREVKAQCPLVDECGQIILNINIVHC